MSDINLKTLASRARIKSAEMIAKAGSSHIGSNFSMAEIISVLYGTVLNISPDKLNCPQRDRFVLSKGHAAAIYYAVLAECGYFPSAWLNDFYLDGARLAGHVTIGVPGVEVSSGSLGHGLSVAVGMAKAGVIDGLPYSVFALLSDGECDEGSTWEAAMFAGHHKLNNLVAIIDYNKMQALGATKDVMDLEPFNEKWSAFGWAVIEVDGHDIDALLRVFRGLPVEKNKPSCIIAHTIKGKGVSFMENSLLWHYRNPAGEEYDQAMGELEACE